MFGLSISKRAGLDREKAVATWVVIVDWTMVFDYGTNWSMQEIAISKFKATCLAVLEDVRRTGVPVRVTRFGRPVAEVVPPQPAKETSWLGCMKDSMEVSGDIVGPIGAFSRWKAGRK